MLSKIMIFFGFFSAGEAGYSSTKPIDIISCYGSNLLNIWSVTGLDTHNIPYSQVRCGEFTSVAYREPLKSLLLINVHWCQLKFIPLLSHLSWSWRVVTRRRSHFISPFPWVSPGPRIFTASWTVGQLQRCPLCQYLSKISPGGLPWFLPFTPRLSAGPVCLQSMKKCKRSSGSNE